MRLKSYLARFFATEASSGILLAIATLLAMLVANSRLSGGYFELLHTYFFGLSLQHWINDGLMVIFFFVVGMEIKRELMAGELSNPKQAALPIAGALGGMIAPALIYFWLNPQYPESRGWGIPMATDIAFALGVLSFFGRRVPFPLKIFLLALAIVDDLGAVLVIAFFYTKEIAGPFLGFAALGLGATVLLKKAGIRSYLPYIALGVGVWYCVLRSGVHATVAGVLLGFLTPLEFRQDKPLEDLVHRIHPWMSFFIMPIFALANAGVSLDGADLRVLAANTIFQGVGLGLLIGKPIGIVAFAWLAVKMKIAQLPRGIDWGDMLGVGFLGGIGFTMALFVSSLALYPEQEIFSKTGILLGSLAATVAGCLTLIIAFRKERAT
jgi:Na+:H+ antiporter, NhaA family